MADETLLRRLADILLDNAFKYTQSPGSVPVAQTLGRPVVMTVEDSGIGIAPEEQSRILQRFYRVDQSRSRTQGGTGLGLAIAKWIVAQHQGAITVDSRQGKGSVFRVELLEVAAPTPNPQPA